VYPVLLPLAGLALPLLATGWLVDLALDRIDARAEAGPDGSDDEPAGDDPALDDPADDDPGRDRSGADG
jgi:hypothetical protein